MDPDSRLAVAVTDGRGRTIADGGLGRWLRSIAPSRARGDLSIAIVTDARIHALNWQYRGVDRPTDVLSFPADDGTDGTSGTRGTGGTRLLGDIVIARGVAQRQAREHGHSLQIELRILALHGLLHLIGYDHDDPDDGGRMKRAEERLRRKGGLTGGLIGRAGRSAKGTSTRASGSPRRRRVVAFRRRRGSTRARVEVPRRASSKRRQRRSRR
jgi:probable rRNA maturation factor